MSGTGYLTDTFSMLEKGLEVECTIKQKQKEIDILIFIIINMSVIVD